MPSLTSPGSGKPLAGPVLPDGSVHAFRSAPYRLLWVSMMGGNGARWAFTMMASWLAYALTRSPFWVGVTMFALQMPMVALSPLSGVLADRVDRARLLFVSIVVSLAAALAVTGLGITGHLTALGLVLGAFVIGLGTTVQSTAQNALLPLTVPGSALFEAVTLQGTARQGAEFVGPGLASPIQALWGHTAALASVAGLFAVGAIPVLFLRTLMHRRREEGDTARPRVTLRTDVGMLRDGVRYVTRHRWLGPTMVLIAVHCLLTMAYMGILPSLAVADGLNGNTLYGVLMTVAGLGAVIFTLGVAFFGHRLDPGRLLWALSILSGVGVATLGLAASGPALESAAFLAGGSTAAFMAVALLRIQRLTDEAMRGRVLSIYLMLAGGAMALGNWGYGVLATVLPVHALPMASGALFIVIVVTGSAFWAPVRSVYARPSGGQPVATSEPALGS